MITVRINLFNIFVKSFMEKSASSRMRIKLARRFPVLNDFRINKLVIDHKFGRAALKRSILESHNTVANHNALKIDSCSSCAVVEFIDFYSQIGNILACVRLSGNPECIGKIFRELFEEILQGIKIILASVIIIVFIVFLIVIRKSHFCWRFEKQQVGNIMP